MEMLSSLWEYVLIFLLAAVPWIEIAAVIPLGILRDLSPVWVGVLAFTGNFVTVFILIVFFEKFRARKKKNIEDKQPSKRQKRAKEIWNKYGLPGITLAAPLFIGTHIAAAIGMALGARKTWMTIWMTISLLIWTIFLTVASYYGVDLLL
ncbi:small multi-drug export protein [Peribacillus tepidiphilus]|jgi:hypothetical protein|uniref:small multi-drug export protein n=1 Tax=Peribacillus tepidiphilus TaxID=2652445 RepID=UPI001291AA27|nr:small multi-drug export protein [Peribacillus tepidiphilus]